MDPGLMVLAAAGLGVGLAAVARLRARKGRLALWRDVSLHFGVLLQGARMRGRVRGTWVEAWEETVADGRRDQVHMIVHAGTVHLGDALFRARTGDAAFDDTVALLVQDRLRLAMLSPALRRRAREVLPDGKLTLYAAGARLEPAGVVHAREMVALIDLAVDLAGHAPDAEAVIAMSQRDPEAGVRRELVSMIVERLRGQPGVEEALRVSCADASPEVRLVAAKALHDEGVLEDLARDGEASGAVRAEALALLSSRGFAGLEGLVVAILEERRSPAAVQAAARIAGLRGFSPARAALIPISHELGWEGVAATEALLLLGDDTAEARLVLLLSVGPHEVQLMAAQALGRSGSPASIEALSAIAGDDDLHRAASLAAAEIRARIPEGAQRGTLSLASSAPEAGAVSVTRSGGELDLPDDG